MASEYFSKYGNQDFGNLQCFDILNAEENNAMNLDILFLECHEYIWL
jgi:hypothetical protein